MMSTVSRVRVYSQLNQGSLQDYVDCQRRFQLKHLLRLAWPAVVAEPAIENERHMKQGEIFHRLVQQHLLGLPTDDLEPLAREDPLLGWWQNYLGCSASLPGVGDVFHPDYRRYVEATLSAPHGEIRLVAKYDLVMVVPGVKAVIYDWKTSHKPPSRERLAARLQTRLYPYLLVRAGAAMNEGRSFEPDQVEMVYWMAGFPDQPEAFPYSQEQYDADEQYLAGLVEEINDHHEGEYPTSNHEAACRFCVYRSLCERGTAASENQDDSDPADSTGSVDLDFEQIGEIKF